MSPEEIQALQDRIALLESENTQPKLAKELEPAPGLSFTMDPRADPSKMQVAMSVTLATRPVQEQPQQYEHVVSPGGLSINPNPNPRPTE